MSRLHLEITSRQSLHLQEDLYRLRPQRLSAQLMASLHRYPTRSVNRQ